MNLRDGLVCGGQETVNEFDSLVKIVHAMMLSRRGDYIEFLSIFFLKATMSKSDSKVRFNKFLG